MEHVSNRNDNRSTHTYIQLWVGGVDGFSAMCSGSTWRSPHLCPMWRECLLYSHKLGACILALGLGEMDDDSVRLGCCILDLALPQMVLWICYCFGECLEGIHMLVQSPTLL